MRRVPRRTIPGLCNSKVTGPQSLARAMNRQNKSVLSRGAPARYGAKSSSLTATGQRLPGMVKDLQLVTIDGGPHAICWTHADQVNSALTKFIAH